MKTEFLTTKAIESKTPIWATYTFRIVLIVTTAISAWIVGTDLINEAIKAESILILKCLDTVVWGISRLFGVVDETKE